MHSSLLLSLLTAITSVQALPSSPTNDIASKCTNQIENIYWFVADCQKGDGSIISSAVYLGNKIANKDGTLEWKVGGEYYKSCLYNRGCNIINGSTLQCSCETADSVENNKKLKNSTLDLSEHIKLINGHLLSSLTKPPIPPTIDAPSPVPLHIPYSWSGTTSRLPCTTSNDCHMTCSNSASLNDVHWIESVPYQCYVPGGGYLNSHVQFSAMKLVDEGGWEMVGYDNEGCEGEPVAKVGRGEGGKCKEFGGWVKGMTFRPLFNADYYN